MKEKHFSVFDFNKRYKSDEDCLQVMQKMRWPNGFVCSHCKHNRGYRLHGRRVIQCVLCKSKHRLQLGQFLTRQEFHC